MYVTNLYNPLTWAFYIIGILVAFLISPFIDESFQHVLKVNTKQFFNERLDRPKTLLKILMIVKKEK
jgi:hypothetical protein